MKRSGIINRKLMEQIAGLGHTDAFMLCDAGFPIPSEAICIDLALCYSVPSMKQCLKAILEEVIVDEFSIASEMLACNPEGGQFILDAFRNQKRNVIPQKDLVEEAKKVKFFVRSGELAPYSNIILYSASGVYEYHKDYITNIG